MFKIQENSWYSVNDNLYFEDIFSYKTIKTTKQVTYYNDVIAFDIETSSFVEDDEYYENDTELYNYITGTKLKITQKMYADIPDMNDIRKSLFGRIFMSKTDGIAVDVFYEELSRRYPYYFPDDIYKPSDQFERIINIYLDNAPEKMEEDNKRAVMYVWQLAINGTVIIGRTWEEFLNLMKQISDYFELDENKRMIIFVHNLSFEFAFIQYLFNWSKVFAISSRKPIYALTDSGLEFRCSYLLSNLSLENVGESLTKYKVHKVKGFNYDLVRHSKTPLTPFEYRYIINDVLVVSAYIKEQMEKEGDNITKLPLTATGYCRNYVRKNCLVGDNKEEQFHKYHEMIRHLTISGVKEYDMMVRAFSGGFTHCSTRFSNEIITSGVDSFDFSSAYPYCAVSEERFPMSKGKLVHVKTYEELKEYCNIYCCIFDIRFHNIRPKYINENYISVSKCLDEDGHRFTDKTKALYGIITNNGRLVSCEKSITMTITELDFEIIDRTYAWDSISIGDMYCYMRGYLPKEIIMSILKLYNDKTKLKGVKGQEDFYVKGKQLLNSVYGMMVTSIIMPVHGFNGTDWTIEHKDAEKEIKRYNKSKKRFLFYAWGIYITALCRRNLWTGILAFGDDYIYSDTDSIKCINAEKHMDYIRSYNEHVEMKLKRTAEHYNIPFEMFKPKTVKGVEKLLGVWDHETKGNKWKVFKSLGAKRYMILTSDNELTITVSGVNKKHGIPYLIKKYGRYGAFIHFNNDLVIPADHTGKLTHFYIDDTIIGEVTDYLGTTIKYKSLSGIYLEKASYSFSIESEYLEYLRSLRGEIL